MAVRVLFKKATPKQNTSSKNIILRLVTLRITSVTRKLSRSSQMNLRKTLAAVQNLVRVVSPITSRLLQVVPRLRRDRWGLTLRLPSSIARRNAAR